MSVSKLSVGRKRDVPAWKWFDYNEDVDKAVCLAKDKTGKLCGVKLAGKNPSNLKTHLKRWHAEEYAEMLGLEAQKHQVHSTVSKSTASTSSVTKPKLNTQTLSDCLQRRVIVWPVESMEYKTRLSRLLDMIVSTACPVTLTDNQEFRALMTAMDPKFKMPASTKVNSLLQEKMEAGVIKLKDLLASCRRVTICLDGWTKVGLSAAFLGISACFYNSKTKTPLHAFLNLDLIEHPHTGEMLASCLEKCLTQWNIPREKVILIVSDNGTNVVKAIRLLGERAGEGNKNSRQSDQTDVDLDDDEEGSNDEENESVTGTAIQLRTDDNMPYRRMGCLAHSLQLVVKKAYTGYYSDLLIKTRALVKKVRTSSVAMERVVQKTGKTVINDNTTRWNSSYLMAKRLLEIRTPLNEILDGLHIDTLLASEWDCLDELISLLEPFASETDLLQSDSRSLSYVIPSLLDLEAHMDQFPHVQARPVIQTMLQKFHQCFDQLLHPEDLNFNPLPAAACLLDPTCAFAILGFDQSNLREAAKSYIVRQATEQADTITLPPAADGNTVDALGLEPPLKKWKFLAAKHSATTLQPTPTAADISNSELSKYLIEIRNCSMASDSLKFWHDRHCIYVHLAPLAEDLVSAPASQAYVERIFSLCGQFTAGRRNRMQKSLKMRVFLKLNANLI